jgi:hypothetical protein
MHTFPDIFYCILEYKLKKNLPIKNINYQTPSNALLPHYKNLYPDSGGLKHILGQLEHLAYCFDSLFLE